MSNDYDKLTERQKRFIDYYIETANATESAKKAGYSEKTADRIGHENLKKLEFFIQEKLNNNQTERIATQNEILEYFTPIMRNKNEDTTNRTKCAELLGKRYGIFKDKVEINQDKPFEVNINIKKNNNK